MSQLSSWKLTRIRKTVEEQFVGCSIWNLFVSSYRCSVFVSCVHTVAVLYVAFCVVEVC